MIVITADQRRSRSSDDAVQLTLAHINGNWADMLELPAERTVGDEFQLVTRSGAAALDIVLHLTRAGTWSAGIGVGAVRLPLADHARESTGPAFIAARDAVDRAKKSPTHCAVSSEPQHWLAANCESLIDLLLLLRSRRTHEGWELHDLLATDKSQAEAAHLLGITPQSASQRARVAGLRVEESATVALATLLGNLDLEVARQTKGHW